MRTLFAFLVIVIGMTSCSAPKLYQKGLDKIGKAIEKDSTLVFPQDTVTLIEYDTIPGVDGKDSIIIQTNTVQLPCDFDVEVLVKYKEKSRRELRFERKNSKDSLTHTRKMYRLQTNRMQDSINFLIKENREITRRLNDANDNAEKLAKQETKRKNGSWFTRMMGRIWWLILIIGIAVGGYLRGFLPF
tara:strand:+ start:2955 stop:3518 length:564 start_codon:yes stop_codon:yes gene_type:complete